MSIAARAAGACLAAWLAQAPPSAAQLGEDPAQLIAQLEARLLAARHVVVEADLRATGAADTDLRGRAELRDRNRLDLAYGGRFAGQPRQLSLQADGRTLTVRNGDAERHEDVGDESNRAVLVGLLRMGLMHNVARVAALQGPDHAGGGVERWAMLDNFRPTTMAMGGELDGTVSFGFDVVVDGQTAGSARLWLDPQTGLPRRRQMTLRTPHGETEMVENYGRFVLE